jgi:uncharacterized Tic20 family protein
MEGGNNTAAPAPSSAPTEAKTNAILAWLFAPITSFAWKDSSDEFLRSHARESLYLGVANFAVYLVLFVMQFLYNLIFVPLLFSSIVFGFGVILNCVWGVLWLAAGLFVLVPRIMGIVKANNREKWEVPYVNPFVKRFIKL